MVPPDQTAWGFSKIQRVDIATKRLVIHEQNLCFGTCTQANRAAISEQSHWA